MPELNAAADASPADASTDGAPSRGWGRGFWSLIATQFQGAFNENGLKSLVIYLVVGMGFSQGDRDRLVLVVITLFSAPFILFSMTGGYLADRYSKRSVTIGTKLFEIAVMLLAIAGLAWQNLGLGLAAVFLASTQAALFGPSKYGMLPELLPPEKLSWGNGVLELGTFVAVILATVAAGLLADSFKGQQHLSGIVFLGLSLAGLMCALAIPRLPPADPAKRFRANPLGDFRDQMRLIRADRVLWLAILGNTYFWFLAGLLQSNIIIYGNDILKISSSRTSLLQAAIAVGIGVGSLAAGYASGNKIEYGLIPLGSIWMTAFAVWLWVPGLSFEAVAGILGALGFAAGFFVVPINALIQHRPDPSRKGGVIAAANLLAFTGILGAGAFYYLQTHVLHLDPRDVFGTASLLNIAATVYVVFLLPDALLRLLLWSATHTIYRIRVEGRANVPERGGVMLAPNHASMVDAVLLLAAIDRPIRFLMFKDNYEHPLIKPFAKIMGVIPISSTQGPREMIHSLRTATKALADGEVVGIFPEGQMTRIGQMLPFRRGMERILKGLDVPVVPVYLDGIWGSIFSFERGRFLWKWPRRIPYPVTIAFGAPLPSSATSAEVRQAVQELGAESYRHRKRSMRPLQSAFIRTARRHRRRFAMADGLTPPIRFGTTLARSVFLARRLGPLWRDQDRVGILLPPSVGGALVNLAAFLMGKVPVNLNYTASSEVLASCARQSGLATVVTSKAFLDRVPLQVPGRPILLEEVTAAPGIAERAAAWLIGRFLPAGLLIRAVGGRSVALDDVATIIFSSGSTGDPKGVLLTHYNIAANVDQLNQVFMLGPRDRILGILPFFHSFGFTGTLGMPAAAGIGVVFHPNPLESRAIGALVGEHAVTFLLATPTFLQAYTRRCTPEDFGSLRFVMAGAEQLPERIAVAFEDRFGLRPLEGYGCTECAPAVAINTMDYRAARFRQVGAKRGSIGHPLPGISVRIVDPETGRSKQVGEPGLLMVRGPNVMQGYLGRPEKTAEVLRDGWYDTGDIATLDEDGFLRITDRLSRFSKIGGEMVPHIRIEDCLHEIAGAGEQSFAVTAIPDERKGERLIVLHTLSEEKLKECLERLARVELPALWKPRPDQFVRIDALPYLGTGKLDLRRMKELAVGAPA